LKRWIQTETIKGLFVKLLLCHTDYRISWPARLRALREFLSDKSVEMRVVEIAGKGSPYAFASGRASNDSDYWHTLFSHEPIEAISPRRASKAVFKALEDWSPDIVIAGSIAFPSGATAVRWAMYRHKPVIIVDSARLADVPRNALVNWVKRRIYANVDAVLLPAPSHVSDYEFWGIPHDRMFFGVNAVDNDFFAGRAARSRVNADNLRKEQNLPEKFLLGVGRQIPKKNWPALVKAWSSFKKHCADSAMQLVLVGNGPDRGNLERAVRKLGLRDVQFRDFASQEELAGLYGLAHALVLPSHGETWGLVINEAMACGLPIMASRGCGCATTLVENGRNGWRFDPETVEDMTTCIIRLDSLSQEEWACMSRRSRKIIANWGLKRFCEGVWEAVCFVQNAPTKRLSPIDRAILPIWNGRYRPV
jgi:1,2-diacylglycerol 3-alpha-glucosyltransferase